MTAAEQQQVLDRVQSAPLTFAELKAALPDLAEKMFDLTDALMARGTIVRVKRTQLGAAFAVPGARVEGRKPDPPAPRPERERKPAVSDQPRHVQAPTNASSRDAAGSESPAGVGADRSLPPKQKPNPPARPEAIAAALAPPPEEITTMPTDWIDAADAAKLLGVSRAYLVSKLKDQVKHEGGGKGNPLKFSRAAVEKFAAARGADETTATPRPKKSGGGKRADGDPIVRVRWLVQGWRLSALDADQALTQIAAAVGAE